jgi:hypothetical protein
MLSACRTNSAPEPNWRRLAIVLVLGVLGGVNALPLDVSGPDGKTALLLALGKDGKAYLLDRTSLGGIGGARAVERVARNAIRTAPAVIATHVQT